MGESLLSKEIIKKELIALKNRHSRQDYKDSSSIASFSYDPEKIKSI